MHRKEFIAKASMFGAICCTTAVTSAQSTPEAHPAIGELNGKIRFMQVRMARLISALDEPTRKQVLETMGRECAKEFSGLITPFIGKPEEFLQTAKKQWMETAHYDRESGTLHIRDKATQCSCAFVNREFTPADFCACTLGWQKEAYSTILGEPVDAELESSVLQGGSQCAFKITCLRSSRCPSTH